MYIIMVVIIFKLYKKQPLSYIGIKCSIIKRNTWIFHRVYKMKKKCFYIVYFFNLTLYEGLSKRQWNQYLLSYAYRFCREYKTKNVLSIVKIRQNTLIINHFIIKYKLHGMVTRCIHRGVPGCSTTSFF